MSVTERMLAAFEGSRVAHGTTTVGRIGRNGKADAESRVVRRPLSEELLKSHINGEQGVGAIPINEDNKCRWGVLDIDIYDLDHGELQRRIKKQELPLLHCRSKSGGAHLYLFLQEYEQAKVVREYLTEMSVALGYSGCEIFPKQDKILAERGDVGNFINLPYYNAETTSRYCYNDAGEAMELEEFLDAIDKVRVPVSALESRRKAGKRKLFADGPPCLQHIFAELPVSDTRNKNLFMCGVYCRLKHGDDWKAEVETFNQQLFDQPLPATEVTGLQNSLAKKDYGYTCDQEPFKSYCDKELCLTRKYGISGGKTAPVASLSNLMIILSEPRLYFLTVDGVRIQLNTEQLQSQTKFQHACMEQGAIVPTTMRPARWQQTVQQLFAEAVKQEVPEELTIGGQFKELLRQYCTSRIRAMHPEELEMGKPWTDNQGFTYFTMSGLTTFLEREKFNYFTRAQIQEYLKKMNGGNECHRHKNIIKADGSRTTVRVWFVPAFENLEAELPVQEIMNDIPF